MNTKSSIKVFLVDDSALVRSVLAMAMARIADIEVIGVASNPKIALTKMKKEWPDVIISDIEMPEMDGFEFLKYLNSTRPTPFIVCSSHTGVGAQASIDALALGAVDIISKPSLGVEAFLEEMKGSIAESIRAAAALGKSRSKRFAEKPLEQPLSLPAKVAGEIQSAQDESNDSRYSFDKVEPHSLIAIGSSTGGTTVIEYLLKALPEDSPPVLIVQHMPMYFTEAFASRLNGLCRVEVKEAADGDVIRPGLALIAPGGKHMDVVRNNRRLVVRISDTEPVNRHKPSVDVLFNSVANHCGDSALGIILTGMGRDGAVGILNMKHKGAMTLAQNEASSAVYGMPKAAVDIGAIEMSLSYSNIRRYLLASMKSASLA